MENSYRKGEIIELTVIDPAEKDQCFGKTESGMGVMVAGMLAVGDRISARIVKVRQRYLEAVCLEVIEPSHDRVEPVCPVFGSCGGCKWMHVGYEAQLRYKRKKVADALVHIGGFENPVVQPVLAAPEPFHYRNKVEFSCSNMRYLMPEELRQEVLLKPKGFALGFHAPGNFEKVLDLDTCFLAKACMNTVLNTVRKFAVVRGLAPYAAKTHEGFLRNVMLRYSERHDQLMVNIVTSWHDRELMEALRATLEAALPGQAMSVVNNVTTRRNTVAVGEEEFIVSGEGFVTERLGSLDFRISANSFFQTNTRQAETLYDQILAVAGLGPDDTVYDLYCGTGTITLYLARHCRQSIGIEVVESAVKDAEMNARLNGIGNAVFFQADLKDFHQMQEKLTPYDAPRVIVTDPPRAGMHPKALETMLQLEPERIVYVSCNPSNLARDGKEIAARGYQLTAIQPVDMFPQTSHIETVACFERSV
ncbi:MAG: 23S rRNA (uracil(1939)-C(5))-methyltransferase RlmD [Chlorobiaceae bacterium]|nr:23S rRNA (uracil(1939)-C(5))-methyltransferase RlmD [Chlorobiaceae bacterium]NTW73338.1 23S rRNA (uracil(1939)-C(5))-methyltransferase RlmD [Chlorobiaceae bacterium]